MTRQIEKVPCPDCGRMFLPRGLASHRRQKHASVVIPSEPAPVQRILEELTQALASLESRLERLEHRVPETEPEGDLRATLSDVLDEIRVVAAERATVEGEWAEERRQACDLELRRLRELQVRLLFELDELPLA